MKQTFLQTCIPGLDSILGRGIPHGSSVLVEGPPGAGKTTFGIQFLAAGASKGECGLYITFEEFPHHIEQNAAAYGWDLHALQEKELLRIVSTAPSIFIEEFLEANGVFETLCKHMKVKRMVIDSISLYRYGLDEERQRETLYILRNICARLHITALLLKEQQSAHTKHTYEHFIADGIIVLSNEEVKGVRMRKLEVTKLRGVSYQAGKHLFRMTESGIRVIPKGRLPGRDIHLHPDDDIIPTGIVKVDQLLNGGIQCGSAWLYDYDSRSLNKYLIMPILASALKQDIRLFCSLSAVTSIEDLGQFLQLYGISLQEEMRKGKIILLEQMDRPVPEVIQPYVYNVGNMTNEEAYTHVTSIIAPKLSEANSRWLIYFDMNSTLAKYGEEAVVQKFPELVSKQKDQQHTLLVSCNTDETIPRVKYMMERLVSGIMRTWTDEYQFFNISKSPSGDISEPFVVMPITTEPFIDLE